MKTKVLICGATGFIGRNISERFAKNPNYEVTGTYFKSPPVKIKNLEMIHADLTNKMDVEKVVKGKDILIQAAAITSGSKDIVSKPYIHITDNAVMNSLLLRSSFENNLDHFIFPSCTSIYHSSEIPLKETDFDDQKIPERYFGIANTKVYIEKMCEFFSKFNKTKHTVLRHSNIYGPYDKFDLEKSHVFGATMTKLLSAKKGEEILVWGDGQEKRDLLYVDDLVDFVELNLKHQKTPYELYNVGLGKTISVDGLVKKIRDISNRTDLTINYDLSKPTIKTSICLDISKAEEEMRWKSKHSLEKGIEKTIDWYTKNIKY
jgi:GDP-L-fucose synthase